jgi:hypothetical protein
MEIEDAPTQLWKKGTTKRARSGGNLGSLPFKPPSVGGTLKDWQGMLGL